MRPRRAFAARLLCVLACSCASGTGAGGQTAEAPPSAEAPLSRATSPERQPPRTAEAPPESHEISSPSSASAATPPPALPEGVVPASVDILWEPGKRHRLRVIHGVAETRRAIVYFAGLCGNMRSPEEWADVVSRYATLIVFEGDRYCGQPGRYKWTQDIVALDRRITAALPVVAGRRGGLLDESPLVAMGYSQGATRAGQLAARFPDRYQRVVAAGMPDRPRLDRIGVARVVAVLGGENEPVRHMVEGVDELQRAGRTARFFRLPGASHGQYGPKGREVLEEVFKFVFQDAS